MTTTETEIEEKTVTFEPGNPARFGRLLGDVMLFASTDTLRPILCGALVGVLDDGTIEMIATNSWVLGHFRDDEGTKPVTQVSWNAGKERPAPAAPGRRVRAGEPCGPYIYERAGLVEIAKRLSKIKGEIVSVEIAPTGLTASGAGWSLTARRVHGDYPNWSQLLPDLNAEPELLPTPLIRLDWFAMLGKLTLGRSIRKGDTPFAVNYRTYGPFKPAAVTGATEGVEFVGLIMPVKA